jgi:hypothetical protein
MLVLNQILLFLFVFVNILANFDISFSVCFEQINSINSANFHKKMVKKGFKKPLAINNRDYWRARMNVALNLRVP